MIKEVFFIICLLLIVEAPVFGELTVSQIVENYADSVVTIFSFDENEQLIGTGSGFFINGNGVIVTNRHVLEGSSSALAKTKKMGVAEILKIFKIDENADIDLVIATTTFTHTKPLLVGDSDSVTPGQEIVVIGNPEGFEGTISTGIVSGRREFDNMKWIQITAPISHVSSGGPVFNLKGEVIGVATALWKKGQNLNFALPVNYFLNLKSMEISLNPSHKKERIAEPLPTLGEKTDNFPNLEENPNTSEFQKIPIWIMGIPLTQRAVGLSEQTESEMGSVLKNDLARSHFFSIADLPPAKGQFSENECKHLTPALDPHNKKVTVSTWGRIRVAETSSKVQGLLFDACAFKDGQENMLLSKGYYSLKANDAVTRLMAHQWADELVYRYTGEQGIARTKIAFVGQKDNGRELFVMDYDGYNLQQITADGYLDLMPTWTPDGRSLIYTAYRDYKQQIMSKDLATGRESFLVPPASLNITASFAPDGKSLTYAAAQDGNSDIYQMELDSRSLKQLTSHSSADLSPSWSPDGRHLAFTSDRGGRPQIYIMDADGLNVRRLTYDGDYNAAPAWSPKGDWIVYVCRVPSEGFKLCRISPNGEQRKQITRGQSIDDSPSWAPNGRHIVFSRIQRGASQLYIITSEGSGLEKISLAGEHLSSPSWSPFSPMVPSENFSVGSDEWGKNYSDRVLIQESFRVAKAELPKILRERWDKIQEEELATVSAGLEDVFFQFDSWSLTTEAQESLERDLGWLGKAPSSSLVIEGHSDQRGTQAYNMVLGKNRAMAIRDFLSQLGVDSSRLTIISYGKDKPFCQDITEVCYQLNRRGHLLVQN